MEEPENAFADPMTRLATPHDRTHIPGMATRTESSRGKSPKHGAPVLGRSAATGRFVLAPASKSGSVTLSKAKTAVTSVRNGKT